MYTVYYGSAPPTVIIKHKAVVVLSVFLFVPSLLTLNAIDENVVLKNKTTLLLLVLCGLKLFNLNLCSLYMKTRRRGSELFIERVGQGQFF